MRWPVRSRSRRRWPSIRPSLPADRRLVFRIGINLGDVVVEGDDLLGDGVNVAARLEQLCEPGGVLVSGTAYDQLQGKLGLPLEFTGEQKVKNIERPVRAYRVRLDGKPARRQILRLPRRRVVGLLIVLAAILTGFSHLVALAGLVQAHEPPGGGRSALCRAGRLGAATGPARR